MSKTPKLCRDCIHFTSFYGYCRSPRNTREMNLVTGETKPVSASSNRIFGWFLRGNTCGIEGHWWEPKEERSVIGAPTFQRDIDGGPLT